MTAHFQSNSLTVDKFGITKNRKVEYDVESREAALFFSFRKIECIVDDFNFDSRHNNGNQSS